MDPGGIDVRLGLHDIVRPDLAGWRKDSLPHPGGMRPIDVVPDWVCEILSPSTAALDRGPKRDLYARAGVPALWIVDPDARTLEAFALRDGSWVLQGTYTDTSEARIAPFEAVTVPVGRLFLPRQEG